MLAPIALRTHVGQRGIEPLRVMDCRLLVCVRINHWFENLCIKGLIAARTTMYTCWSYRGVRTIVHLPVSKGQLCGKCDHASFPLIFWMELKPLF